MEHPGTILREKMDEANMSRKELALRTGVTEKHICTVINCERGISASFAKKLGYVFESTKFWLGLQAEYEEEQARMQEANAISAEEIEILKPLHEIIAYFIELGIVYNNCGDVFKVLQMRNLLNISDLTIIPMITYNAAYRAQVSTNIKVDPYVLFAWQRLCEMKADTTRVNSPVDTEQLRVKLPEIKSLMFANIEDGISELQQTLSECGIAFQVVKNFRGAPVQGFIKETNDHKVILCLTIRRQRADTFWFTLFHELAHILNGDFTLRFVDFDNVQGESERKADEFARDLLIPPAQYKAFIRTQACLTWAGIEQFAKTVGVQPYIVLGRLQSDGILDWSDYSDKLVKYKWA